MIAMVPSGLGIYAAKELRFSKAKLFSALEVGVGLPSWVRVIGVNQLITDMAPGGHAPLGMPMPLQSSASPCAGVMQLPGKRINIH